MGKYDYLIVGAGVFGATFARKAADAGKRCLVIDKRGHVGGNCHSHELEGVQVHKYGPHIFHTDDKAAWDFVNRFAEFNNFILTPIANYCGGIYNLPFNMNTFSKMWGVRTPDEARAVIDSQAAPYRRKEPANLEEQALSLVGGDIYEKLIKGYTEKQWGRPCTELPAFIIKRLPLRFTFDNNYFNDRYQGIPAGGYTKMFGRMLDGIDVELGVDYLAGGSRLGGMARRTVYTGQIDGYFGYSLGSLEYRSLRFETETLGTDNHQGTAVMNYTDPQTPFTRCIEHKHFEFGKGSPGRTVITREYPMQWERGGEAYYPVNDEANNALYARYEELAKAEPQVIFGGRLGTYSYLNMDRVITEALACAGRELAAD